MARIYHRDSRGRFASGGGSSAKGAAGGGSGAGPRSQPAAKRQQRKASSKPSKGPANAIKPSPLRLSAEERIYAQVATGKKRSDKQFRAEMERLGAKNMTQERLLRISRSVSVKMRHDPIEGRAALKSKLSKALGAPPKKKRR